MLSHMVVTIAHGTCYRTWHMPSHMAHAMAHGTYAMAHGTCYSSTFCAHYSTCSCAPPQVLTTPHAHNATSLLSCCINISLVLLHVGTCVQTHRGVARWSAPQIQAVYAALKTEEGSGFTLKQLTVLVSFEVARIKYCPLSVSCMLVLVSLSCDT